MNRIQFKKKDSIEGKEKSHIIIVFTLHYIKFSLQVFSKQTQTAIITKYQNMSLQHAIVSEFFAKKKLLDFVYEFLA